MSSKQKNKLLMSILMSMMISMSLVTLFYQLNKMEKWDMKMSTSFECGFSAMFNSRYSFTIPFMFTTLIFLILDLEFCLIMPMFFQTEKSEMSTKFISILTVMILMAMLTEWSSKMMEWMK